jgi:DNA-directed RNA polymerase specialized sigma24 family protein
VNNRNEEERMNLAYSQPADHSEIELQTVMSVEKVLRKVRAFTCLVIGNRVEADEIVEDALILYLATDPEPNETDGAYPYLIAAVRRLLRTTGTRARRGTDLDQALAPLLDLPLETREIAALHLGAGFAIAESASLLGLTADEAVAGLDTVRLAIGPETYDRAAPAG